MQVTIELTEKEYKQIEKRVKIAIATKPSNVANLSVTDQVLVRLCLAVIRGAHEENKEKLHERQTT